MSGTRRTQRWQKKPKRQCRFTLSCRAPRGRFFYCARHRERYRNLLNANREFRRRLGLCIYCTEPAASGHRRCHKHLEANMLDQRNRRDQKKKARGWRMVKVAV